MPTELVPDRSTGMMLINFRFHKDALFCPEYLPTPQGRKLLSQDVNFMVSHLTTSIQSTVYTESNAGLLFMVDWKGCGKKLLKLTVTVESTAQRMSLPR
jgi:hypothetical protein